MNQGEKYRSSCPQSNARRSAAHQRGKHPSHHPPARPCPAPAEQHCLLKAPELWPLISLCTHVLYQNNSSNNARILPLPSAIASEGSPLKGGSICNNAKAEGLPSPTQLLARQLQFIQNKWIFQLWVIHQKKTPQF